MRSLKQAKTLILNVLYRAILKKKWFSKKKIKKIFYNYLINKEIIIPFFLLIDNYPIFFLHTVFIKVKTFLFIIF